MSQFLTRKQILDKQITEVSRAALPVDTVNKMTAN